MSKEVTGDLSVPEGVSLANWFWGRVSIKAEKDNGTSVDVSGINIPGVGAISYQATARTRLPWSAVSTATVSSSEDSPALLQDDDGTSFRIWIRRNTNSVVSINWMVWRDAT